MDKLKKVRMLSFLLSLRPCHTNRCAPPVDGRQWGSAWPRRGITSHASSSTGRVAAHACFHDNVTNARRTVARFDGRSRRHRLRAPQEPRPQRLPRRPHRRSRHHRSLESEPTVPIQERTHKEVESFGMGLGPCVRLLLCGHSNGASRSPRRSPRHSTRTPVSPRTMRISRRHNSGWRGSTSSTSSSTPWIIWKHGAMSTRCALRRTCL